MGEFRRVSPGEPLREGITARWYNRINESLDVRRGVGATAGRSEVAPRFEEQLRVLIKNDTGADLTTRYPILRVTSTLFEAENEDDEEGVSLRGVQLKGDTPNADTLWQFVVVQGPCPQDGLVEACFYGLCWAMVDVQDEGDPYAVAQSGNNEELISNARFGARIIWSTPGTGPQLAAIDLKRKQQTVMLYAITATIPAGAWNVGTEKLTPQSDTMALITPHDDDDGTYTFSENENEDEIFNPFGTSITVTAGKFRVAEVIDGWIVAVDCTEFDLPA